MQRVILLTEEEYNQIKSESPSSIMQATINNLKSTNDKLTAEVFELRKELQTYKLGGAKPRLEDYKIRFITQYSKLIESYNLLATNKIKESLVETSNQTGITVDRIKQILKDGVANNIIKRQQSTHEPRLPPQHFQVSC